MIVRSIARQRNALLNTLASSRSLTQSKSCPAHQIRTAFSIPSLSNRDNEFSENGIGELFSGPSFRTAWKDYQGYLINRINTLLADDATRQRLDVKSLSLATAREPSMAPLFNYSSMAHNNHFFFSSISPTPTPMPDELADNLTKCFSSVDTLRSTFLTTGAAMFGPGFVWLVQTENPSPTHPATPTTTHQYANIDRAQLHFRIVTTYLAGSPYPQAHTRQQGRDMNVQNLQSIQDYKRHTQLQNTAGNFGRHSPSSLGMAGIPLGDGEDGDPRRFGVADITPVLCVNTWEHCYLQDFGVAGKREYLEKWWDAIDWATVWSRCFKPEQMQFLR